MRCLTDHGEFETQDGDIIVLKKNSQVSGKFIEIYNANHYLLLGVFNNESKFSKLQAVLVFG